MNLNVEKKFHFPTKIRRMKVFYYISKPCPAKWIGKLRMINIFFPALFDALWKNAKKLYRISFACSIQAKRVELWLLNEQHWYTNRLKNVVVRLDKPQSKWTWQWTLLMRFFLSSCFRLKSRPEKQKKNASFDGCAHWKPLNWSCQGRHYYVF